MPPYDIIHQLKGSTANAINKLLDRKGRIWQREYYDHWVRNGDELMNIIDYIIHNPVKAKLTSDWRDWQWTWINPDLLSEEE